MNTCENSFFGPHLGLGRQKNVIRLGQTPDVRSGTVLVARQRYSQREVSSSSLTVRSGTVPPQKKTFQARRAKRCILTRRARPKEGFLGYGAA